MIEIFNSFWLIFLSEMGDKTQLLAMVLAARYKKPLHILAGIFVATVLNHALASWGGMALARMIGAENMALILAVTFIAFAFWILIPDKLDEEKEDSKNWGAFLTTTVVFFLAEMGDKTQFATVALAAKHASVTLVTLGSTLGMMAANGIPVLYGDRFLKKVSMQWIRVLASVVFFATGVLVYIKGL